MADIEEGVEEEFKLAQQMKDRYCDESGKETNSAKAAKIIHQIGQIYRKRSPDKISLIKSAGLFNAAIARNPSNIAQIRSDLSEICQHILQKAEASNQSADLIRKAEQIKASINKLRSEIDVFFKISVPKIPANITRDFFQKLMSNKISAIKQINKTIAVKYKQIMADLSQYCEDVMGKPPCEYAIAGMGSLAREEITPYSDFEHIILLFDDKNYKTYLEYFKWFSVIFHIVVLNLQETIIASLNVMSLNDKNSRFGDWYYDAITPRGISFDGMMPHACKFPLGRAQHTKSKPFTTELIKPVSEMLEYLSSEADLKNGYHLADILTKTCFVFGSKAIFKEFDDGAQKYRDQKSRTSIINDVQQQVKDDLNSFSTRFRLSDLHSKNAINIKQFVYRSSTIFIAALARLYNISANSCFDIIEEMAKSKKTTENTARKLQCAIAIACEMRIRVYMTKKSQCDNAVNLKQENIEKFLDIVGVNSIVNYFQITYCLQCEVAKQLNFTKLHFYSDPNLINITIGLAFRAGDLAKFSKNPQKQFWEASEFDFDDCIDQVEKQINLNSSIFNRNAAPSTGSLDSSINTIKSIADYLYSADIYDEALDFYKQLQDIYQRDSKYNKYHDNVVLTHYQIGRCLIELNHPNSALTYLNPLLLIKLDKTSDAEKDKSIADTLDLIGRCHIDLGNYNDALTYFNRAIEIETNVTPNAENDRNIAKTFHEKGLCLIMLHNYADALTYLNRSLKITQNSTVNADKDNSIAATLLEVSSCHINLGDYNDALTYLNQALKLYQNATLNAEKDTSIAGTLHNMGFCHFDLHNYDDALTCLNRALEIYQSTTLNADTERNIAVTLNNIARCHIKRNNYVDALTYLHRTLKIYQNITLIAEKDRNIADTLDNIGPCYAELRDHNRALTCLIQALEIRKNITDNAEKDRCIADTMYNIGSSHIKLHNYEDAFQCLTQALKIYQNTVPIAEKDRRIADTLHKIFRCHIHSHEYNDALTCLNEALEIYENTSLNTEKELDIATILRNIGCCHINLHNFDNALTYLKRALKIYQNTTLNAGKDRTIADTLNTIGRAQFASHNYDDALTYLSQSLKIYQNTTLNAGKTKAIAKKLEFIGRCHFKLRNYNDALTYFSQSLKIYQNTTQNVEKDRNIAMTLDFIGRCHFKLRNYADALTYLNRALKII